MNLRRKLGTDARLNLILEIAKYEEHKILYSSELRGKSFFVLIWISKHILEGLPPGGRILTLHNLLLKDILKFQTANLYKWQIRIL